MFPIKVMEKEGKRYNPKTRRLVKKSPSGKVSSRITVFKKSSKSNMLSTANLLSLRNELINLPGQDYYIEEHRGKLEIVKTKRKLAINVDEKPYEEYIKMAKKQNLKYTQFYNRSGDTLLFIPIAKASPNITHFAKNTNKEEWLGLWKVVKQHLNKNKKKKLFISTHGHGVDYLHVRLEEHPKYYVPKI
tara:strand:+ start:3606 stop:4172 length:567 start_codon:yes stop_codon:yes gene_type:complete